MIESQAPRVVFDCNVYFQALVRDAGPAADCLRLAETSRIQLVISPQVLQEVGEVLRRPKTQRKFPRLTLPRTQRFLARISAAALLIENVPQVVTLERDPDDAHYLDLAVASGAAFLVSRDQDLLHLRTAAPNEALALRQISPDLEILDPVTFLTRLRPPADDAPPEKTE